MRDWKLRLNLKSIWKEWEDFDEEYIDYAAVSRSVAAKLRKASWFKKYPELEIIAKHLEKARGQITHERAMHELWDWADGNDCWVHTVF